MGRYRKSHPIRQPLPRIEKKSVLPLGPILVLITFVLGSGVYLRFSSHMSRSGPPQLQPSAVAAASDGSVGRFEATVENQQPAPGHSPQGMAWVPGGEFSMGANDPPDMDEVGMKATIDARPIHRVYVDGFYMDKTDVTNA